MSANPKMHTESASPSHNVVNGIDTDAVQTLIENVEANPAKGMTHWRVASAWQGGTTSRAQVDGFAMGGVTVPRSFSIDFDEPREIGGTNTHANPQEYLLAALNACMIVGYTALCALHGITLERLEIATEGDIDLRGFFGLDASVAPGYRELHTRVVIKSDGSKDRLRKIHDLVMATSPNVHNVTWPVSLKPTLVIE
jgi:uncharacterized OsmC-like protein